LSQEKDYFGLFGSDKVDVEPRPDPFFFPNYSEPPPLPDKTGLFPDFSQPPPLTGNLEMPEERASTSSGSQKRRCREYDADEAEEEVAAANKKPKPEAPTANFFRRFSAKILRISEDFFQKFCVKFNVKKRVITTFSTKKHVNATFATKKMRNCSINRFTTQIIASVKGKA